jgi:hypothetical protein
MKILDVYLLTAAKDGKRTCWSLLQKKMRVGFVIGETVLLGWDEHGFFFEDNKLS